MPDKHNRAFYERNTRLTPNMSNSVLPVSGTPLMVFGTRLLTARRMGANSFRCFLKLESISMIGDRYVIF